LLAIDIKTLARMTGKDFSGPVPEIRVPPQPISIVAPSEEDIDPQTDVPLRQHAKKRSRGKSQSGVENGVIVVGDVDTFQS
jgi:transcription factor TFIIIB component B''